MLASVPGFSISESTGERCFFFSREHIVIKKKNRKFLEQKGNILHVVQPTMHSTLGVYDIHPLKASKISVEFLSMSTHNPGLSTASLPLTVLMWEKIPDSPRLHNFIVGVRECGSLGGGYRHLTAYTKISVLRKNWNQIRSKMKPLAANLIKQLRTKVARHLSYHHPLLE